MLNKKYLIIFLILTLSLSSFSPSPTSTKKIEFKSIEFFLTEYQQDFHPGIKFNELLFVSVKSQRLYLLKNGEVIKSYPISSSKYGIGSNINSKKTPTGLHTLKSKVGSDVPINGIIKSGSFSGKTIQPVQDPKSLNQDYLTTRVICLIGEERGINKGYKVDSFQRGIYIHGTPEEGLIGTPASHGCIRMKNSDIIELFNKVNIGAKVLILNI